MSAENKALVRRWIKEIWSKGSFGAIEEIVAPNYESHGPTTLMPEAGREGLKEQVSAYRTAFPDLTLTIDDIMADGNNVIARWTARGAHKGTLLGSIRPTGKEVTTTGISIIRITSGKIAEHWVHWDALGMMQQLDIALPIGQVQPAASAKR
jgi:steroid delta-isomerase-like uncharacterized protein